MCHNVGDSPETHDAHKYLFLVLLTYKHIQLQEPSVFEGTSTDNKQIAIVLGHL